MGWHPSRQQGGRGEKEERRGRYVPKRRVSSRWRGHGGGREERGGCQRRFCSQALSSVRGVRGREGESMAKKPWILPGEGCNHRLRNKKLLHLSPLDPRAAYVDYSCGKCVGPVSICE